MTNYSLHGFFAGLTVAAVFVMAAISFAVDTNRNLRMLRAEAVLRGHAAFVIDGKSTYPLFKWKENLDTVSGK